MVTIDDELIFATRYPDGSTAWTLACRLGVVLKDVQERHGPREADWTILGFEFGKGQSNCWFPGDRRDIVIRLGEEGLTNKAIAHYNLGHEAVHLLDPVKDTEFLTVLEEALAEVNGIDYGRGTDVTVRTADLKYVAAERYGRILLKLGPDVVRTLRTRDKIRISNITAEQLLRECPKLLPEHAAVLATRWKTWNFPTVLPSIPE